MKYSIFLVSMVLLLVSCRQQNVQAIADISQAQDTLSTNAVSQPSDDVFDIDTTDAQVWIIEVIENHLNEGGYAMEDICTPKYLEYKTDATESGYDGGMTEDDFKKKWATIYDVKHAGIGTAFLISGQDNGKVKVTQCNFKSPNIFSVIISDPDMNMKYHRDIKVLPIGKAYQIDDIVEFD